jgi:2-isopropylmalate synthase
LPVHPRHPYAGDLVYTSFSGSHQDAIKKAFAARRDGEVWDMPYLPIDPKDLGRSYEAVIRINSQSGKGGIAYLLETERGLELPRLLQIEFSQVVQAALDDVGKEMTGAELWTMFEREYAIEGVRAPRITQQRVDDEGAAVRVSAHVAIEGREWPIAGSGTGPVDAFVAGLNRLLDVPVEVIDYHEHAIGRGADARAAAYIELRFGAALTLFGVGIDGNIVSASLKALASGVQRALRRDAVRLAPALQSA